MNYVHIIAVLAILQFFYFAILVGRAREKYGVKAPATSGHEGFDRAFRVQMNTLEQLVAFLPALLLASLYWPNWIIAAIGVVYLIGRFEFRRSYVTDPAKRGLGFVLTVLPTFVLLLAVLVGAVLAGGFFKHGIATASAPNIAMAPAPGTAASAINTTAPTIASTTPAPAMTAPLPSPSTETPVLSATAYDKVTFGDRLEDIEKLLGEKAPPPDQSDDENCWYAEFKAYPGVRFMVEEGRVNRLDSSEPVVTSIGHTIGALMAEISEAIPTATIEPNKYDPEKHYITVMSEDGKAAILLDESQGRVVNVRGGLLPAVQYVEGCL